MFILLTHCWCRFGLVWFGFFWVVSRCKILTIKVHSVCDLKLISRSKQKMGNNKKNLKFAGVHAFHLTLCTMSSAGTLELSEKNSWKYSLLLWVWKVFLLKLFFVPLARCVNSEVVQGSNYSVLLLFPVHISV